MKLGISFPKLWVMCRMANGPFSNKRLDSLPGVTICAAANPAGEDVEIGFGTPSLGECSFLISGMLVLIYISF